MKQHFQKLFIAFLLFGFYSTTHPNILFDLLKKDRIDLVKKVLNQIKNGTRPLNIDATNDFGSTILHKIILISNTRSNLTLIKLVLECGADVNACDKLGITPLHLTCFLEDNRKILQLLLDNGAQVNATTKDTNVTPLHIAAQEGRLKNVQVLIRNNANTEAQDYTGCTPMFNATGANRIEIVKFLMKYTRDIPNNDGTTVRRIMENKNYGNIDLLGLILHKIGPNKQHVMLLGILEEAEIYNIFGKTNYHICGRKVEMPIQFKKCKISIDETEETILMKTIVSSLSSVSNQKKQTILAYACNGPNCDKLTRTGPSSNAKCPCGNALYCSTVCQKNHWPQHKTLHRRYMILQSGCAVCQQQQSETKISLCSRCHKIAYCSAQCQKNDWKSHKPNCHQ